MRIRTPFLPLVSLVVALVVGGPGVAASAVSGTAASVSATTVTAGGSVRADVATLGLVALGQTGAYFEATITAGTSLTFEVDRVNPNAEAVETRTYVGVVSTIVNGGFGAADSTVAVSWASTWVDYPAQTLTLAPQEHNTAVFTVAVPAGTAPGQYVSSIVLENAEPEAGTGQVALNRIVRQAIAVSIRVPGELAPAFSLGLASLGETAGNTVVTLQTTNDGNQHLAPAGVMTLKDSLGAEISTNSITMGSFYAGMSTRVSVGLTGALDPGDYLISLELTDPLTGVSASVVDAPLTVAAPSLPERAQELLAQVPPGHAPWLIVLLIAGALGLVSLGVLGALGVRRLRRWRAARAAGKVPVTAPGAAVPGAAAGPASLGSAAAPDRPARRG